MQDLFHKLLKLPKNTITTSDPQMQKKEKTKLLIKTVIDNKELGFLKKLPCIYANWGKRGETKGEESAMTN